MLYSGYQTYCLLSIKYTCKKKRISIEDKQKKCTIDLTNPFFVTIIHIRFYHGKSSELVEFYLFSSKPISNNCNNLESLNAVLKLLKGNSVILPVEETTQKWLFEEKKLKGVPEYPKIMYYPKEPSEG